MLSACFDRIVIFLVSLHRDPHGTPAAHTASTAESRVSPAVLDDPVTRAIPETPRHFLRKKRENGDQGISKVTFPSHHMKIKRNRKLKQQGVSSRDDVACAS